MITTNRKLTDFVSFFVVNSENNKKFVNIFKELLENLEYSYEKIPIVISFMLNTTYKIIGEIDRVENEQLMYMNRQNYCTKNSWFCEIHESNSDDLISAYDNLIISMFVHYLETEKAQIHAFIVKDINYMINNHNKKQLRHASIYMHSFASNLFDSEFWYSNPVGDMTGILGRVLGIDNVGNTPMREYNLIRKSYTQNLGENCTTLMPSKKIKISDYLKYFWKTINVEKNESKNYILGQQYELDDDSVGKCLKHYILFLQNTQTGGMLLENNYYQKYLKYKKKYLKMKIV